MVRSIAFQDSLVESEDFGGDKGEPGTTRSYTGEAILVPCMKCKRCGYSITV